MSPMPSMLPDGKLTPLGEKILLALWKTQSTGSEGTNEESLKVEFPEDPQLDIRAEITNLQTQGFLDVTSTGDGRVVSLTVLGISILRQIEEDKLQELK